MMRVCLHIPCLAGVAGKLQVQRNALHLQALLCFTNSGGDIWHDKEDKLKTDKHIFIIAVVTEDSGLMTADRTIELIRS